MPTYTFEALNEAGKPQKGTINAATSEEAIARIRSQGYFPTSVREQKTKKSKADTSKAAASKKKSGGKGVGDLSISIGGVSQKNLTTFTRQLSTLQDAGLPILRSLAILEQQQKPGLMKNTLSAVHEDVSGGSSLSDSMSKHPKAFNTLYTKMIAAGEVGGVLDLILQRLSDFLEKAQKLKKRIISAMIYPAAVISIAAIIVLGIMILIVPKFVEIFNDFDTDLPLMTKYLIEFAKWLAGPILPVEKGGGGGMIPGVVWVVLSPLFLFLAFKFARKTAGGKSIIDSAVLWVPILGGLIRKATIAKFSRTLGTLINAGVPILDAIKITSETTGNDVYARALMKVHDSVRQGDSFAEPLRKAKVCDSLVVNMIDVGEETGDLDKMLTKIADNYDEEVDVAVASLVSLLEPVMVVILGGIVGFIVVSLFLPLVKLMQSVMQRRGKDPGSSQNTKQSPSPACECGAFFCSLHPREAHRFHLWDTPIASAKVILCPPTPPASSARSSPARSPATSCGKTAGHSPSSTSGRCPRGTPWCSPKRTTKRSIKSRPRTPPRSAQRYPRSPARSGRPRGPTPTTSCRTTAPPRVRSSPTSTSTSSPAPPATPATATCREMACRSVGPRGKWITRRRQFQRTISSDIIRSDSMGQLQESLSTHFQSAGRLTRGAIPFPKLDDLTTSELAGEVESVYRSLGGKLISLPLNLRKWDIEFDGVAVELDEHLHFNRYRGTTLSSPAYEHLSGFPRELYLDYCASHEADCLKAGSYGGKWTNNNCEKQFGCSSTAGTLSGEGGAARWKQRAYYDFVKDLSPILIRTRVVRLAIWDLIDEKGEKRLLIDALLKPTECTTGSILNLFRLRSA